MLYEYLNFLSSKLIHLNDANNWPFQRSTLCSSKFHNARRCEQPLDRRTKPAGKSGNPPVVGISWKVVGQLLRTIRARPAFLLQRVERRGGFGFLLAPSRAAPEFDAVPL